MQTAVYVRDRIRPMKLVFVGVVSSGRRPRAPRTKPPAGEVVVLLSQRSPQQAVGRWKRRPGT